jgi:hypothetical protein
MVRIHQIAIMQEPDPTWSEFVEDLYLALKSAFDEVRGVPIFKTRDLDSEIPSCFIVHGSSRNWETIAPTIPDSCWILLTGGSGGKSLDSVPSDRAFFLTEFYGRVTNFADWYQTWFSSGFEITAFRSSVTQLRTPIPQSLATAALSLGGILASVCIVIEGARSALTQSTEHEALIQWTNEGIALVITGVDPLEVTEELKFLRYALKDDEARDRVSAILDPGRSALFRSAPLCESIAAIECLHGDLTFGRDWLAAIAARRETAAKLVLPLEDQLLAIVAALREVKAWLPPGRDVRSTVPLTHGAPAHLLSSRWARVTIMRAVATAYPPANHSRWLIRTFVEPGGALHRLIRSEGVETELRAKAQEEVSRAILDLSALARFLSARPRIGSKFHRAKQIYKSVIESTLLPRIFEKVETMLLDLQEEYDDIAALILALDSDYGLIVEPTLMQEAHDTMPAIRSLDATFRALRNGSGVYEDAMAAAHHVSDVMRKFERLASAGDFIIDIDAQQVLPKGS